MGIINITPDSFYEASRKNSIQSAVDTAMRMIEEGADVLDIGGESTRPGSEPVKLYEEIERVIPVIRGIREKNSDILISVDTYRAETAREAVESGADIINDISAMSFDYRMPDVVKELNVPVILMHMKGNPGDMQKNPCYVNVVGEVMQYLQERINYAVSKGISREKIIVDPGIGFGKLFEHNIELIKNIDKLHDLDVPILLAASRKSTIGSVLGNLSPQERLEGTIATTCYAVMKGVEMVRVHDVKENRRAALMMEVLK